MTDTVKAQNGAFMVKKTASYLLPIFEIEEGKGLQAIEGKTIELDFVRNTKTKSAMALLQLTDIGQGPIWQYESPEGKISHYPLDHSDIQKVEAKFLQTVAGDELDITFELQIFDGEKNTGIQVTHNEVLTGEDKVIDKGIILGGEGCPGFYMAAVDIKQNVPAQSGTTIECLLNMTIYDLKMKHQELPSRETAIAINKLEEAQMWLNKRTLDRTNRGVDTTNNN